jgi:hypothetical protein
MIYLRGAECARLRQRRWGKIFDFYGHFREISGGKTPSLREIFQNHGRFCTSDQNAEAVCIL